MSFLVAASICTFLVAIVMQYGGESAAITGPSSDELHSGPFSDGPVIAFLVAQPTTWGLNHNKCLVQNQFCRRI